MTKICKSKRTDEIATPLRHSVTSIAMAKRPAIRDKYVVNPLNASILAIPVFPKGLAAEYPFLNSTTGKLDMGFGQEFKVGLLASAPCHGVTNL